MKKLLVSLLLGFGIAYASDTQYPIIAGKPHAVNKPKYIEVYAHRGDRSFSPENTLPAYRTGLSVGTDWADMDIGVTKDGVIIVDHDVWLNPDIVSRDGKFIAKNKDAFLSAAPKGKLDEYLQPYLVHNLTLKEIETYDVGTLNPDSPYAKYFPEQLAVPGTHMPTLQQVIDYVNQTTNKKLKFQIEFKNDPTQPQWTVSPKDFAKKLYAILKKNDLIDRAEIQSFDWQPLYELQKLDPKVKTAYLVGYDDIERMKSSDPKQAGLWSGGKLLKDYNNSLPQMVKALGGACYEPEDVSLTKEDLDEAHRLGLKVAVWTWPEHSGKTFDPILIQKLIDWGVDGIITDDPGQLNSMLAARGYRVPQNYPSLKPFANEQNMSK